MPAMSQHRQVKITTSMILTGCLPCSNGSRNSESPPLSSQRAETDSGSVDRMLKRKQMHDMLSSKRPSLSPPPSERSSVTSIDSCHDSEPVVCVEECPGSNSSQDGDAARILDDSTSSIKESGQPLCTAGYNGYQDGGRVRAYGHLRFGVGWFCCHGIRSPTETTHQVKFG